MTPALDALIERKVNELLLARLKASATTPQVVPPHGPNALFNTPGLGRTIVNAGLISPLPGLYGSLEAMGHVHTTRFINPVFPMLTGQTASTGDEPTENCAPGRRPGNLKICKQTWAFGQLTMTSQVVSLHDAGQVNNTGESLDLQLIGNPFADLPNTGIAVNPRDLFLRREAKAMVELINAFRRDYCGLTFTGNPANTAASAGGYKEYNGLDRLINTGYKDSETGIACAAADSTIVTNLSGLAIESNSEEFVSTLVEAYDYVKYLAAQLTLGEISWAFVMRRGAFRALTEIWPCTYRTYRCNLTENNAARVNLDGNAMANMVVEMRKGEYLLIDGIEVPVIIDDCQPETFVNNASAGGGTWTSDIYLVPLKGSAFSGDEYSPSGQITFLDFFDYNAPGAAADVITGLGVQSTAQVSRDGRYLIIKEPPTRGCYDIQIWTRPRLINRAPFLSVKFEDVRYQKRFQERGFTPGGPYTLNGGSYSLLGQTFTSPLS